MAQNTYMNMIPEPVNEGEVLTVVNGEWQSAEPGGGGGGASGIFIVHPIDDGENYYLDKNFAEISGAVEAGNIPFHVDIRDNGSAVITLIGYYYIEDGTYYVQVDQDTLYSADSPTGTLIFV